MSNTCSNSEQTLGIFCTYLFTGYIIICTVIMWSVFISLGNCRSPCTFPRLVKLNSTSGGYALTGRCGMSGAWQSRKLQQSTIHVGGPTGSDCELDKTFSLHDCNFNVYSCIAVCYCIQSLYGHICLIPGQAMRRCGILVALFPGHTQLSNSYIQMLQYRKAAFN